MSPTHDRLSVTTAKRRRARTAIAATVLAAVALPRVAHADGEAWQQFEYRLPIIQTQRPTYPRFAWRVYSEAREAGRFAGLYDLYLRTGPMLWVSPFLFIAAHGTFQGTRTAGGCAMGAAPSCGQYVFEFRAELEPNFFGRIGPFTFNDRNRLEMRWRESGITWRYRNQLRINYQPQGARIYPFVIDEWLFNLSADSAEHAFNQNRLTVGVAFQVNPHTRLDVGYMLRSRLGPGTNPADPWRWDHDHIGLVTLVVDVPPFNPPPPVVITTTNTPSAAPPPPAAPPPSSPEPTGTEVSPAASASPSAAP